MSEHRTLNRADIAKLNDKIFNNFISSVPNDASKYGIRITSGTSGGEPIMSVLEYGDKQFNKFGANKRIITCVGSRNAQLANVIHLRKQISDYAQRILLLEINNLADKLPRLLEDFSPEAIFGHPSFVSRLVKYFNTVAKKSLSTMRLAGERVTKLQESVFNSYLPKVRVSMHYAVNEVGLIGEQCVNLLINQYHPISGVNIEIVEKDATGAGDILISKKLAHNIFLEKYDIGDTGRFLPDVCACGERIIFEHLGRNGYDYVKIAGALVKQDELDRIMPPLLRFMDDYRVEVSEVLDEDKLKGKVVLRAFSNSGFPTRELIEEMTKDLSNCFYLTPTRTLADLVKDEEFVPLSIEFTSSPFPQKNKNSKLVQIIG